MQVLNVWAIEYGRIVEIFSKDSKSKGGGYICMISHSSAQLVVDCGNRPDQVWLGLVWDGPTHNSTSQISHAWTQTLDACRGYVEKPT